MSVKFSMNHMKPALPKNGAKTTGVVKNNRAGIATSYTAQEVQAMLAAAQGQQQGAPTPSPAARTATTFHTPTQRLPPIRSPASSGASSETSPQAAHAAAYQQQAAAAAARAAAAAQAQAEAARDEVRRQAAGEAQAARQRQRESARAAAEESGQQRARTGPPTGGVDADRSSGDQGDAGSPQSAAAGGAEQTPTGAEKAAKRPRQLHRAVEAALKERGLEATQLSRKGVSFFPRVLDIDVV
jgi:hypothetical protein